MRIAVVSDIHANRTALEAVLADLRQTSPDLILHGGDLADSGSSPADVLDRIRDLGWPGVAGNTDEMLFRPESLDEFAAGAPHLAHMFSLIREIAEWNRATLGEARLGWLRQLPRVQIGESIALFHATPETCWRAPGADATDAELQMAYANSGPPIVIYGHVHVPYVRTILARVVANAGSVGLPYDGDTRASYLILDDDKPEIRRVEYDIEAEIRALRGPHSGWIASLLRTGRFQMPPG